MNLHPLIVHFPIVCLILAPLFDWISKIERLKSLQTTGFTLLIVGALTTIPSAFTGEFASEGAQYIPGISDPLHHHGDLSTYTLWLAIFLAAARIHLVARKRYSGAPRVAHTILLTVCAGLVSWSAYTGGLLVHEYGAGTRGVLESAQKVTR